MSKKEKKNRSDRQWAAAYRTGLEPAQHSRSTYLFAISPRAGPTKVGVVFNLASLARSTPWRGKPHPDRHPWPSRMPLTIQMLHTSTSASKASCRALISVQMSTGITDGSRPLPATKWRYEPYLELLKQPDERHVVLDFLRLLHHYLVLSDTHI
jgi:hypothetical protein